MEQLELPLEVRHYRPLKDLSCPCCKQDLVVKREMMVSWVNYRKWLVANWDHVAAGLVREHFNNPQQLSLEAHPDLLWALKAEASDRGLELNDCLAEILDGYFQGEFNALQRRGCALKIPSIASNESDPSSETD